MELWFIITVIGAIAAGVSNFFFKIAAARNCNAELFMFYSSVTSILIAGSLVVLWQEPVLGYGLVTVLLFGSGVIGAASGSLKVYALRYIDSTIYFPLFKLVTPALAIVAGVTFFAESFSVLEWIGLVVGLLVPLMLISPAENTRQQNLPRGLLLVVVTGVLSALTAVAGKYAIDAAVPVFTTLLLTVVGIGFGSIGLMIYKRGIFGLWSLVHTESTPLLLKTAITRAVLISFAVWAMLFAFSQGGTLSVVQTIHSMYILIPIVLAIIFYNEHWNWQKAVAIALSVVSLGFLG
jgi:drug/metabolite transporter (DMT)-like permease